MDPEPIEKTETASLNPADAPKHKRTKKEFVLHELQEVFFMVAFLSISLSLIATFRSLVLIQNGVNDFAHSYVVAGVMAIALGKIIVLAQKLPIINALDHRPLIWSVLYKASLMTVIADLGTKAESRLFPALSHSSESAAHHLALIFAHQIALMSIFIVLFTWRELDRVWGHGTLFRLFFLPREAAVMPMDSSM